MDDSKPKDLPPFSRLLSDSWNVLHETYRSYLKLFLLMLVFGGLAVVIFIFGLVGSLSSFTLFLVDLQPTDIVPMVIAALVAYFMFASLGVVWNIGTIFIVHHYYKHQQEPSFSLIMQEIRRLFVPAIVLSAVLFLLTMGGFLLLIIPAILFSIWFGFAYQVLIAEGRRGMNAALASRDYMKGYTLRVFLYSLAIGIVVQVIVYLPSYVLQQAGFETGGSIFSTLFGLILAPFTTIFSYLLYHHLHAMKGAVPDANPARKRKYALIAVAGPLVFAGLGLYALLRFL